MSADLLITNCTPHDAPGAAPGALAVRAGRIVGAGAGAEMPAGAPVLDAGGRRVIPGAIDVHVHGVAGADLMDGTAAALATISAGLARLGTTGFLATGFFDPDGGNEHLARASEAAGAELPGARLLGLHLEGPFVNPLRRGGIPERYIAAPTDRLLDRMLDACAGTLRVLTLAPELEGALPLIARLRRAGVVASLGHTDATYEQTRTGIDAGIGHVTHLWNAMRGLHHREPGPLLAIQEAGLPYELVCDDVHVSRHVARWTAGLLGLERCMLVTDGIRTTGLPEGEHAFGAERVVSSAGAARRPDGTLIGTSLPLLEIVRRLDAYSGCGFDAALACATRVPAELLGLADRKGAVAPGYDADLVVLEADGSVWATVVGGRVVYRAASGRGA